MIAGDIERYLSGLRDPVKEVRARSVENLVRLGEASIPPLLILLSDDDWKVRYRAAEALGMMHDPRALDPLIGLTNDEKDHVRYMATKSLSQIHGPRISPVLIRMLSDDHSYTRKAAAGGLARAAGPGVLESLQQALERESDPDVRSVMMNSVALIKKRMLT